MNRAEERLIHLLYVPTLYCNLACKYCYLGDLTEATLLKDQARAVDTLRVVLQKMADSHVIPFNVSLHGGEVGTLSAQVLAELFEIITDHYRKNFDLLQSRGIKKFSPHIKTNLFYFHKLYDLLDHYRVSISASVDLPLAKHGEFRVKKNNESSLDQILSNLKLLARYPHAKKISCTLCREHLEDPQAFIQDIWYLHREIGISMQNFNLMFAFSSNKNSEKLPRAFSPMNENDQLKLYHILQDAFVGTELEEGFRRHWFEEFSPQYCTNAVNCGEKFYLLQSDGNVYSCVRGQGLKEFHYGNFLDQDIDEVLAQGARQISEIHGDLGLDSSCQSCSQIQHCNTGCPVVKVQQQSSKSYTCQLQKQMYADYPLTYPVLKGEEHSRYLGAYVQKHHPSLAPQLEVKTPSYALYPKDLSEQKNTLRSIIDNDPILQDLYHPGHWIVELGDEWIPLESPLLKSQSIRYVYQRGEVFRLHFKKRLWSIAVDEPVRNTLYLQMLRDTHVVYGDEKRLKQEHVFNYQIYANFAQSVSPLGQEWCFVDLGQIIDLHREMYVKNVWNNLFVTTSALRDYHYSKQKNNAFYHIQAINLPFQNFEFYFLEHES